MESGRRAHCRGAFWGFFGMALAAVPALAAPRSDHKQLLQLVDSNSSTYVALSRAIWEHPELGYHETQSTQELQGAFREAGFKVVAGVADEPTAFVASYGE